MVSCFFTAPSDLDAEFPAVAARRLGLDRVPLLCAQEIDVPGALPRVIRVLLHYYAPPEHTPQHVYLRRGARSCAPIWRGRSRPGGVVHGHVRGEAARIPGYQPGVPNSGRGAGGRSWPRTRAARLQRVAVAAGHPAVVEAVRARPRPRQPLSGPERGGAAAARWPSGYDYPSRDGSPSATARARSCWRRRRRCSSRERTLVYAWPSFSMYPHLAALSGAREIACRSHGYVHDLERDATAITGRDPAGARLQPQQPDRRTPPARRSDRRVHGQGARAGDGDRGRGLHRVPAHRGPDATLPLLDQFPNLVLLRTFSKCYGLAGLRVGYGLGTARFRAAVDAVRQPFSVNAIAQAAATEAILHQDHVVERVERTVVERVLVSEGLAELGFETPESATNFSWVPLGDRDEDELVTALAEQGIVVRAGTPLGGPGHVRVTYGTRQDNERLLAALSSLA